MCAYQACGMLACVSASVTTRVCLKAPAASGSSSCYMHLLASALKPGTTAGVIDRKQITPLELALRGWDRRCIEESTW
jgi:hypothetical protein